MRTLIVFILLLIFASPIALKAQELDQQKLLYQNKVISFTKMKHAGIGLTFGGAVLQIAGVALMVNSANNQSDHNDQYGYSTNEDWSGDFLLGYLSVCAGVTATTGGIVLWTIGASKKNSYARKLNSLSLNVNPNKHQAFSLAYRF